MPDSPDSSGMALSSMMFGIASLIFVFFGGSLLFGSLGLIMALLSRREHLSKMARIGAILSSLGMALTVLFIGVFMSILVKTGTMDKIIRDVEAIDASSANAPGDMVDVISGDIKEMISSLFPNTTFETHGEQI